MRKEVLVNIETLNPDIQLPTYANDGDSGCDVRAAEDVIINPQETKIVPTGIKVAIPKGYEIQVRPRSGISLNTPLRVSNSPGTIDEGFRNEIGIIIHNSSVPEMMLFAEPFTLNDKGNQAGSYIIKKGDRICQFVLQEVPKIKWEKVESVKDIGEDRMGGFGSTKIE